MSNISIVDYHSFSIEDLKKKIGTRKLFLLNEYGSKVNNFQFLWVGNTASFSCNAIYNNSFYPVTGQIVLDTITLTIIVSTNVTGFLFNLAKPFIENKIRQEIKNIFQTPVLFQITPIESLSLIRTSKFKGTRRHRTK
jgi:hypothetical protein